MKNNKISNVLGVNNFRNVHALTLTSMLIALTVVCNGLFRITIIPNVLFIVVGFLFIATIAYLFGPVMAFTAAFTASVVTMLMFPTGASFNPLFDLNRGLAGIFYAIFLFRRNHKSKYFIIWVIAARVTVRFVCYIFINTYLMVLFGFIPRGGGGAWIISRLTTNIVMLPIDIFLLFAILKLAGQLYNDINLKNLRVD